MRKLLFLLFLLVSCGGDRAPGQDGAEGNLSRCYTLNGSDVCLKSVDASVSLTSGAQHYFAYYRRADDAAVFCGDARGITPTNNSGGGCFDTRVRDPSLPGYQTLFVRFCFEEDEARVLFHPYDPGRTQFGGPFKLVDKDPNNRLFCHGAV